MQNAGSAQGLSLVSDEDRARGRKIQQRMRALGISGRQFSARTGIDRRTLQRAMDATGSVREGTYDHIETWLERLERKAETFDGIPDVAPSDEGERFVELELEGVFGIGRVVVRGPVDDPEAVVKAATELMRQLRAEREGDGE